MKRMRMVCVIVFALIATLALPVGMINFIAADSTLRQVTLNDQGESITRLTGATTVADFLSEAGIELNGFDRTDHALSAPIWDGIVINVSRGVEFIVRINNYTIVERAATPYTTISQILMQLQQEKEVSLIYGGNYERVIINGEEIDFLTWVIRFESEVTELPYSVYENETSNMWVGTTHLRQEGSPGIHEVVTGIVYIGGIENNRDILESTVLVEPVSSIMDIGTASMGALADVTADDFHYVRRIRMEATAYTAGFLCTGKHPWDPWYGITASGRRVEHGIVAVDRSLIPLGTRLYVEGHGFSLAADVGSAIRGYSIDLFMYERADALRFGRRHLYVWILE